MRTPSRYFYYLLNLICGLGFLSLVACDNASQTTSKTAMIHSSEDLTEPNQPVHKTDAEWKAQLSAEEYRILRQSGTERAFGKTYKEFKKQGGGAYHCAGCDTKLFTSEEKFDAHCGWPAFYDPADAKNVTTHDDYSGGSVRTEVRCANCDGHLGHVFKGEGHDTPTDQRYCINGIVLKFVPDQE